MSKASLLWIDLEMTGLDPVEDKILEVAAIATGWDFSEVATYEAVVSVDPVLAEQRMVGEFWDKFSAVRQALLEQNLQSGQPSTQVERELIKFIDKYFDKTKPVYLAGNSVWNDRKFIELQWPRLDKKLHHRMLDVSAWKLVFEQKFDKKFTKPDAHRAADDIRGSISELKNYLKYLDVK
ncbi:MAG: oligoribonuclease [Candidatus Nomurabacteria bacterium]|jgi:oligoribonuclease|nr:oligoribonuclease [Candidatus Nomurabacteria bacterium]